MHPTPMAYRGQGVSDLLRSAPGDPRNFRLCEGFRMPAASDDTARSGGRRTKTSMQQGLDRPPLFETLGLPLGIERRLRRTCLLSPDDRCILVGDRRWILRCI
jgi:hypothetical protein